MDRTYSCHNCKQNITEHGYKCVQCSTFFDDDIIYCQRCVNHTKEGKAKHEIVSIDYTEATNAQLIKSVIEFEKELLRFNTDVPKLFPHDDQDASIWKQNDISKISYLLPNEMPFKDIVPFVCDYLRMNNSLKYLIDKLNLKLCSTDIIIIILKYTSFDVRLSIIEQLCAYQRAVPIYFGVPCLETSSMKYYFLIQEMSHILLRYIYQTVPFILSFGTQSCKGKTLLLNTILKTNFDCHHKAEFIFEEASAYYHNKLIQISFGHQYDTERGAENEITRTYQCHALDLHGTHVWDQMPSFFIEFMSAIIIHLDVSDMNQLDSLPWPTITFNQEATYIIFIHGDTSDSDIETNYRNGILKNFGLNKNNVHLLGAKAILNGNGKALKEGVLMLLKKAPTPKNSLLNVSKKLTQVPDITLSTRRDTLCQSKQLLDEFCNILDKLPNDNPALNLFPCSRLRELSEKGILSSVEEEQKKQLTQKRNGHNLDSAHDLLAKLAKLVTEDTSNISFFETAILLWNKVFWQRKQQEIQGSSSPTSLLQKLEMSKEYFLREFQERSKEYIDRNGSRCSFPDAIQMKNALIKIYQHSFRSQEYIEIINATSSTIYPEIFEQTFANNSEDLRKFFVIGIIGEQSSGKSFLINKVFGTKIAESKFKCTTGILATRVDVTGHERVHNVVILDTEGLLDQSKKNTEAQIFDRKMVLAVMARSQVVMINISRNVNKTMQQILEIVFYGLNKLHITNKPKMIFLFRDQNPNSMGESGQRNHVTEVMKDIQKSCEQVNFSIQDIIHGFDIHEFPSPFVDLIIGGREISFFSNSFCQKALSLRLKIIDQLAKLTPFDSFNEWLTNTLDIWQQINQNSNLFDYESLVHLTLEKELEAFCNRVLTDANRQFQEIMNSFTIDGKNGLNENNILDKIQGKLSEKKSELVNDVLSNQLNNEKKRLMQKHNLHSFPEVLFENTKRRIESTLNLYKTEHYTVAERQFQQDEYKKRLDDIPKQLAIKIRNIQSVVANSSQFEKLFNDSSSLVLKDFEDQLEDYIGRPSGPLDNELIKNFREQSRIDEVGIKFFNNHISDSELTEIVRNVVLKQNLNQSNEPLSATIALLLQSVKNQHGSASLRHLGSWLYKKLFGNKNSNSNSELEMESMLAFVKAEYTRLQNSPYFDSNILPKPALANECVKYIRKAIEKAEIKSQDVKNLWYTCYGIILSIFCDEHYNYIYKKLKDKFEQEISRRKEEVKQRIINATTAEEHGEALIKQIWTIIQNDTQKRLQDQFERFFLTWDVYTPSVISENCVNQLFRSTNYQSMFDYIQDPINFTKQWLRSEFDMKYTIQLNQTIYDFSSQLEQTKKKFDRMISCWSETIQKDYSGKKVSDLINSLTTFLSNGSIAEKNINLTESAGGFSILKSSPIRTVPESADKDRLLKAMESTCNTLSADHEDSIKNSTKSLLNGEKYMNRLFDRFYNRSKGCGTPCPYCKQICDNDNPEHTEHRTEHHMLWVYAGYRDRYTGKPSLTCCTSNEAFSAITVRSLTDDTYIPFAEHLKKFNPTWKIINKLTPLQDYLLKAYVALEEELAAHYKFEGRVDIEIRKKFLRSTVTPHCYALLVGIDYENTDYSLRGVPSNDVTCIGQQLENSFIANRENLCILKNNEATKENILQRLNTIIKNMDKRSTFIFYFSGHGGRRTSTTVSYLLTSDKKDLTALELAAEISHAMTNKIIIILDSCFSGDVSNAFSLDFNNVKEGIHILCSSKPYQVSYQLDGDKNGFFTKHLLKGLKGEFLCEIKDCMECRTRTENLEEAAIRKITSTELVSYLSHAVTRHQDFTYTSLNTSDFDISFLD